MHESFWRGHILLTLLLLSITLAGCAGAQATEEEIEVQWSKSEHADTSARAFTNWDDSNPLEIPESCAKCHSTAGYHDFLGMDGSAPGVVDSPAVTGTTVECEACHNEISDKKREAVMPSGAELGRLGRSADCMECHQGRASTIQVNEATEGMDADTVSRELSFINIHNNAAGPTLYGTMALGGYEYEDREYLGYFEHAPGFNDCIACHDPHTLRVKTPQCRACHPGVRSTAHLPSIRMHKTDYDGDGNTEEGIQGEIETMRDRLLIAIRAYAALAKGTDRIVYEPRRPFFFNEETGEPYVTWTPKLLRAAYNYHYVVTGDGAYAHNPLYTLQLLYDSLEDLGAPMSGLARP